MASSSSPPPLSNNNKSSANSRVEWELNSSSIPDDVALNIASFLQASDLCSLGSCSRFWNLLCASDFLWISLSKKRWPSLDDPSDKRSDDGGGTAAVREQASSSSALTEHLSSSSSSPTQGWKSFYIKWHEEMAGRVSNVIKFVKQCSQNESLEVGDYLKAVADLHSMELGFMDVKLFLFTAKHSVLLNLIGLHYSIFWLGIPANDVMEALQNCQVSERQICVNWFKLGRWFYGFRLPDESRSRKVSLCELITPEEEEVCSVLNRGAVHEVLHVHITSVAASTS